MVCIKTMYHATDKKGAEGINRDQQFRPGKRGFAGAGIYFADNRDDALRHCFNGQTERAKYVITCKVDVGHCVTAAKHTVDLRTCVWQGYDSVHICGTSTYAVLDPSRITIKAWRTAETGGALCDPPVAPKQSQQVLKKKGTPCSSPQQALAILVEAIQACHCKKLNASTDMGPLYKRHQGLKTAIGSAGLKGFCEKHKELVWDKESATVSMKKTATTISAKGHAKKPKETAMHVPTAAILAPPTKSPPCVSPQQALAILVEAIQDRPCKKLFASTDIGPLYKKHPGLKTAIGSASLKGFCEKHEELVWDKNSSTISMKKTATTIPAKACEKKPKKPLSVADLLTAEILASPTKSLYAPLDIPKLHKKYSFLKQALGSCGVEGFCKQHPSFKWQQASMTVSLTQMVAPTPAESSPLY